jgi:hypothetical protein
MGSRERNRLYKVRQANFLFWTEYIISERELACRTCIWEDEGKKMTYKQREEKVK